MHYRVILRILGILLMVFSFTMLPPVAISWFYQDGALLPFAVGFAILLSPALPSGFQIGRAHV